MNKIDAAEALKKYWGYQTFKPLQKEAVEAAISGRDSLIIMPTGGGKSMCYQLPAACNIGLVIVVSPLIALMDDQVSAANACGIKAGALHSQISSSERYKIHSQLRNKELKLLYVSPEKIVSGGVFELIDYSPSLFAVDEAHCVSHWGHEFRPEYRQLSEIFDQFSHVPRMALTATATVQVQADISKQLGLRTPLSLTGHPDRPNLTYRAFPRYNQTQQVLHAIQRHPSEGGIVYAQTRKEVDRLAKALLKAGVSCAPYHAGLSSNERSNAQQAFIHERLDVIVATIAFGMGIDRSNVRYVIHANTPKSIEHYQQESGRAGRDGEPAECMLLFSAADLVMHKTLSLYDTSVSEQRRIIIEKQLTEVGRYATTPLCRHKLLTEHFGAQWPPENSASNSDNCGACDICLGETEALLDEEAQHIMKVIVSAAYRTEGRFGGNYITKVVMGDEDERIISNNHHQLKVFGMMKDYPARSIRTWIDQLAVQGVVKVTDGKYPLLQATPLGISACRDEHKVRLTKIVQVSKKSKKAKKSSTALTETLNQSQTQLFENLRKCRLLLARKLSLPPYMIFPDSVLISLAIFEPDNIDDLIQIKGIGERKRNRFGQPFLEVIAGSSPEDVAEKYSE